jgi:hypothetical protein
MQAQRRFEYDNLHKLANFSTEYNAVCDAVPDLSLSMQINWDTLVIPDFERYVDILKEKL